MADSNLSLTATHNLTEENTSFPTVSLTGRRNRSYNPAPLRDFSAGVGTNPRAAFFSDGVEVFQRDGKPLQSG